MSINPRPASQVEQRAALSWLWPGWIPFARNSVVQGDGGLGKGLICAWLAASLSRGGIDGSIRRPSRSLIVSVEESIDVIRPRLAAAGANLDLIDIEDGVEMELLHDLDELIAYVKKRRVRLITLDPLHTIARSISYDIRRALIRLANTGAAVVVINHLNGASGRDARGRGFGGRGLQNLARATHVLAPHPEDAYAQDGLRILAPIKINDAPSPRSLAGKVDVVDGQPVWRWIGECDFTADDLLARRRQQPRATPQLDEAIEFLHSTLADGPVGAVEVEPQAVEAGISAMTLRRAREAIGIVVGRVGFGPGSRIEWSLPRSTSTSTSTSTPTAPTASGPARPVPVVPTQPSVPSLGATPPTASSAIDAHHGPENVYVDPTELRFSLIEIDDLPPTGADRDHRGGRGPV